MKPSIVIFGAAFVFCGSALAQDSSVSAGASSQSTTSISTGREATTVQHEGGTAAAARSQHSGAYAGEGSEMNATLTKPVDARRAKPGDEVVATLAQDASGRGDVVLRRGTKLIGHVTEAHPRAQRSGSANANAGGSAESRLGIAFDRAILEDGREVPIVATIQAIAVTETATSGDTRGFEGPPTGSGTFGSGRVGSGLVGGVTGTLGGALGGPSNLGGGLGGAAGSSIGSTARASGNAVGGLNSVGRLTPGSRGVFGVSDMDLTPAVEGSSRGAAVLTSRTSNVALDRGTQLLLVGSADGAVGAAPGASLAR